LNVLTEHTQEFMNISPTMQRYAAEIYRLQQDHQQVPVSLLTDTIEASPQAVSKMVRRLMEDEFLEYEPYYGIRLNPSGERIAMPALRRHRIAEVFLVRIMGYDWASAHELTDVFELGLNDELEDRMFEMTGRPTRCPHGEPIPSKDGVMPKVDDMPLLEVPSGSDCVISRVRTHDFDKLRYIGSLGLEPGIEFHLASCAPFKGPLRLQIPPVDQVIGYELAQTIWVEVTKLGEGNKRPPLDMQN
jgi:DtxR family Mn-dependent transcriptional regulator